MAGRIARGDVRLYSFGRSGLPVARSRMSSALAAFVVSEATLDNELDGALIEGQFKDGKLVTAGPAQNMSR